MDLMRILQSLEEFLYELVGWLVFYPRTFWRVLCHPAAMARYTRRELLQPSEQQFTETISPVLMLILSVVLAHVVELVSNAKLPVFHTRVAAILFGNEQGLLLSRCVAFCAYALVAALVTLHQQRSQVTRDTLRVPFSIQAFLVSPLVVALSVGNLLSDSSVGEVAVGGRLCMLVAFAWYVWARVSAYRALVQSSGWKALLIVLSGLLATTMAILMLVWILVGRPT